MKKTKNWVKLFNPETDRILAFTNKRVIELNDMVEDGRPLYYNEPLLMNGIPCEMVTTDFNPRIYPSCVAKGQLLGGSKLIKKADEANRAIAKFNTNLGMYKQVSVLVDEESYLIYYDPNHYATEQRLKKDVEVKQREMIKLNGLGKDENIPNWCKSNRQAQGVRERGQAWSKYLAHKNYVFSLIRPHASTVHKAQGSEFSQVFVDVDDIHIAKSFSEDQYNRLMYVALSRAIDKVIYI